MSEEPVVPVSKNPTTSKPRRRPTPPLSDLMRTPAAMEYSQRGRASLYRMAADGLIGRYRLGSAVYWSRTELDAAVQRANGAA